MDYNEYNVIPEFSLDYLERTRLTVLNSSLGEWLSFG